MDRAFFLNIVIRESSVIIELFTSKNKSLLITRDSLPVFELFLQGFNRIVRINIKSNSLSSKCPHEYLHASSPQSEHQMDCVFLRNVVVWESSVVIELFTSKNKALLITRDSLPVFEFILQGLDWIVRINIKSNSLTS